jgi:hypothetical protein
MGLMASRDSISLLDYMKFYKPVETVNRTMEKMWPVGTVEYYIGMYEFKLYVTTCLNFTNII